MSRQTSPSAKSVTWGGVNYKEYDTHERIISNRRSLLSPEDEPERGKDFHYDLRYRSPPRYTEEQSMRMIDELNSHHSHSRSNTPLTQGSKKAATRRTKSKGKKEDKKQEATTRKKSQRQKSKEERKTPKNQGRARVQSQRERKQREEKSSEDQERKVVAPAFPQSQQLGGRYEEEREIRNKRLEEELKRRARDDFHIRVSSPPRAPRVSSPPRAPRVQTPPRVQREENSPRVEEREEQEKKADRVPDYFRRLYFSHRSSSTPRRAQQSIRFSERLSPARSERGTSSGKLEKLIQTPDPKRPTLPTYSMVQQKLRELGNEKLLQREELEKKVQAGIAHQVQFKQSEAPPADLQSRYDAAIQSIITMADRIKTIDPFQLSYSTQDQFILDSITPPQLIIALCQYEKARIATGQQLLQSTLQKVEADKKLKRKTQYLKMQLMLDTKYNDKIALRINQGVQELKQRLKGIQKLVGLRIASHFFKMEHQDITYKDALTAQIFLKIDHFSGAIDIESLRVMTKFSVQNHLIPFELNPLLYRQKQRIWKFLKKCTMNALKLYGVRQFRLGFFLFAKPLYNLLEDIALVSLKYALKDILFDEDEILLSLEILPLHQDFQTTLNIKVILNSKNELIFQLSSCRIEPLFTTKYLKLYQFATVLRDGRMVRKQVMTPWRARDDNWKRHDYKVVLRGYYEDLKKCWRDVSQSPSYHKLLDLAILTQEIFYYED